MEKDDQFYGWEWWHTFHIYLHQDQVFGIHGSEWMALILIPPKDTCLRWKSASQHQEDLHLLQNIGDRWVLGLTFSRLCDWHRRVAILTWKVWYALHMHSAWDYVTALYQNGWSCCNVSIVFEVKHLMDGQIKIKIKSQSKEKETGTKLWAI